MAAALRGKQLSGRALTGALGKQDQIRLQVILFHPEHTEKVAHRLERVVGIEDCTTNRSPQAMLANRRSDNGLDENHPRRFASPKGLRMVRLEAP